MEKNFTYGQMKAPGKKKATYDVEATCNVEATCEKEKINYFSDDFLINNYHSEQVGIGTGVRTDRNYESLTINEYLEKAKTAYKSNDRRNMEKYLIGKFSDSELAAELAEIKTNKINRERKERADSIYRRNMCIFDLVENVISNLKVNDMFTLETFNNKINSHPRVVSKKLEMLVESGKLKTEKRRICTNLGKIVRKVYIVAE